MISKTEELKKKIEEILYGELTYRNYLAIPIIRHNADLRIDQLVKACKESDMVFVDREAKLPMPYIPMIDIDCMDTRFAEGAKRQRDIIRGEWHKVEEIEE